MPGKMYQISLPRVWLKEVQVTTSHPVASITWVNARPLSTEKSKELRFTSSEKLLKLFPTPQLIISCSFRLPSIASFFFSRVKLCGFLSSSHSAWNREGTQWTKPKENRKTAVQPKVGKAKIFIPLICWTSYYYWLGKLLTSGSLKSNQALSAKLLTLDTLFNFSVPQLPYL